MTGYTAEQMLEIIDRIESNLCAECRYDHSGELIDQCRSCAEIDQAEQDYDHDKGN